MSMLDLVLVLEKEMELELGTAKPSQLVLAWQLRFEWELESALALQPELVSVMALPLELGGELKTESEMATGLVLVRVARPPVPLLLVASRPVSAIPAWAPASACESRSLP